MWGFHSGTDSENKETEKPNPWATALNRSLDEAKSKLGGARKRTSEGNEDAEKSSTGKRIPKEVAERAARVFSPETWKILVRLPFALWQGLSGRACVALTKEEEEPLAVTSSATAEYFLTVEPKYACVCICAITWATVVGTKMLAVVAEMQKERALANESNQLKQAA